METVGPLLGRDILAVAFGLTAVWKITHRREYANSFTGLRPSFIREFEGPARVGLILAELGCAVLLAVTAGLRGPVAEAGPALAIALLAALTTAVARQPSVADCGCWSSPVAGPGGRDVKRPLLARNAILLAAGLVAVIPASTGVSVGLLLSAAAFAAVAAPVILELPQVIAVATFQGGSQITGARS
jgi:Methylamine utilisation protein MauE